MRETFDRLTINSRRYPFAGCMERTIEILMAAKRNGEVKHLRTLMITPEKGNCLFPAIPPIDGKVVSWGYHCCPLINGEVWDPSFGRPIGEKDYYSIAFPDQKVRVDKIPAGEYH
jgi:hypothetical protein